MSQNVPWHTHMHMACTHGCSRNAPWIHHGMHTWTWDMDMDMEMGMDMGMGMDMDKMDMDVP